MAAKKIGFIRAKRKSTAGTGPHPSASAMQHASSNARFKRGTAKPTTGGVKKAKRTPTSVNVGRGGEQGRPGSGIKVGGGFVGKVGSVERAGRRNTGIPGKVVSGPRPVQASPNPGIRPGTHLGAPSQAVPGSVGTNTGAIAAPKRLGAPTQVTSKTGPRPSARAMQVASSNARFKRAAATTTPSVVSGKPAAKGSKTNRPGKPVSIAAGGVHTTGARKRGSAVSY